MTFLAMTSSTIIWWVVLMVCTMMSSLYSGMETGVYGLNKIRLELHADRRRPGATALQCMVSRFDHLLVVLLIGTNLCRYVATFATSALFLAAGHGANSEWLTLAVLTPVMFVVGDSIPKNVFHRGSEALIYRFVWLLRVSALLFTFCGLAPLVRGFASLVLRLLGRKTGQDHMLARRGIETIVAEGHASGLLTDYQSAMADRASRFADVRIRDVMSPLGEAVTAPAGTSREELAALFSRHSRSRVPLLDETGLVTAILDMFDLLVAAPTASPADLAQSPLVLPEQMPVSSALLAIQGRGVVMAVAADAAGRHVGIITVKDIAEEIVGDLIDDQG